MSAASRIWDGALRLKSADSTQAVARRMVEGGAPEWSLVRADRQTEGRGRMGRRWKSPKGGLYLSVILRPRVPPSALGELNRLAAESVARALASAAGVRTTVKPPNDVLAVPVRRPQRAALIVRTHGFRKVCGILLEASGDTRATDWVALGIGINVNNPTPKNLPKAASLRELAGRPLKISRIAQRVLEELRPAYRKFLTKF